MPTTEPTIATARAEPLHHVWSYTQADREFWDRHLEGWVPKQIIDAHVHVFPPEYRLLPMSEQMKRQYWVNEVIEPITAEQTARCNDLVFPGRDVTNVAFGFPSLEYDIEATNSYLQQACPPRGWKCLAVLRPEWSARQVEEVLSSPGVVGLKPYYSLISFNPDTRDEHLEASIFDFLPHHALEVADRLGSWVTLHVPKADRLGHPDNIREIKLIRERYPRVRLVIAHLGRSYTLPHAQESLPHFKDDPGLYFDCSAVLNPDVMRFALETIGPYRFLYGTDNPMFYMRGRRRWQGRTYINHTDYPFHFNRHRESPAIEAGYTLYMYESLYALRRVCDDLALSTVDIRALFYGNAQKLLSGLGDDTK
ncbi:MAG: amidohydrolase family protein [Phycisphaerales bacterium]